MEVFYAEDFLPTLQTLRFLSLMNNCRECSEEFICTVYLSTRFEGDPKPMFSLLSFTKGCTVIRLAFDLT